MENDSKFDALINTSSMKVQNYKFKQEIPKSPNPLKLSKWYSSETQEISEQIDMIENECNFHCSCSKGCSACCNQLIVVSSSEFLAMQVALENLSNNDKLHIKEIVNNQYRLLEDSNITNATIMSATNQAKMSEIQEAYFKLNLPCALLDENNECLIYSVRPTLCLTYRFYGDKNLCKTSFNLNESLKYDDWESAFLKRLFVARKPSILTSLQFALKEFL